MCFFIGNFSHRFFCTMDDIIGTFCSQAGITLQILQSNEACFLKGLFVNGAALEILNPMDKGHSQDDIFCFIRKILQGNEEWNEPSKSSVLSALHRVKSKVKLFKKTKSQSTQSEYPIFMFSLPKIISTRMFSQVTFQNKA